VYAPNDDIYKSHRPAIYSHLTKVINTRNPLDTLVITGDWNACLTPTDRETPLTSTDLQHIHWMNTHPPLRSAFSVRNARAPTYTAAMAASPSMIDDTLLLPPSGKSHEELLPHCSIQLPHQYATDHGVLAVTLNASRAGIDIPNPPLTPHQCHTRTLVTPISAADKLHFAYISVKNTPTTSNTLDIDWTPSFKQTSKNIKHTRP
jgi:hypothetical protein